MKSITQFDSSYKNACGIYQITHKSSGKKYIGSTNNINNRRLDHLRDLRNNRHCNPHLQNAWNKYGESDFVFQIIEITTTNTQFIREQWYLDNKIDWNNDFNSNKSASLSPGTKGTTMSDETKKKKSIALKGKKRQMSDDEKRARSESAKLMNAKRKASGWTLSKESREKRSEIAKRLGLKPPLASFRGKNHSTKAREKIGEASKRMWDARRNKNVQ